MCRVLIVLAAVCALVYGSSHRRVRASQLDGHIVGGHDVDISELPYQLSLQSSGFRTCGASIISADWAVTAAHCVDGDSASWVSLRAGSSTRGSGGTVHQAASIIVHPKYDAWTTDYDYALIKVATPFPIGANVQPIELAEVEPAGGDLAITSGWGTLPSGFGSPRQLQVVDLPIVARDTCQESYRGYDYTITERMICAGVVKVGCKDACQGESGGPLTSNGKLVGIVSWGTGCARSDYPGVFTNIADQRDWIREQTGV